MRSVQRRIENPTLPVSGLLKAQPEPERPLLDSAGRVEKGKAAESVKSDAELKEEFNVFRYKHQALFHLHAEGRPLYKVFGPSDRADQVKEYLRRHQVIYNRSNPPGLRKLTSETQKVAQLEHLRGVAYHYPYQVMDVLFRQLPKLQYNAKNFQDSISTGVALKAVFDWYQEFPHIRGEIKNWLNVTIRAHAAAAERVGRGDRQPRIGKTRIQALDYLVPRIRAFDG